MCCPAQCNIVSWSRMRALRLKSWVQTRWHSFWGMKMQASLIIITGTKPIEKRVSWCFHYSPYLLLEYPHPCLPWLCHSAFKVHLSPDLRSHLARADLHVRPCLSPKSPQVTVDLVITLLARCKRHIALSFMNKLFTNKSNKCQRLHGNRMQRSWAEGGTRWDGRWALLLRIWKSSE